MNRSETDRYTENLCPVPSRGFGNLSRDLCPVLSRPFSLLVKKFGVVFVLRLDLVITTVAELESAVGLASAGQISGNNAHVRVPPHY